MPKWIPCKDYAAGDVIRWEEPVWKPRARKTSRPVLIGTRLVTAQLAHCDGDWLQLALKSCVTTNAETWWKRIPELKADKPLRRQRAALGKRKPERLKWSDESARAITVSRFLG